MGINSVYCIYLVLQVVTRLLFAATPLLYWFSAYLVLPSHLPKDDDVILMQLVAESRLAHPVIVYFLSFTLIGTVVFVNGVPWT